MTFLRWSRNPGFYKELIVTCVASFSYLMFGITRSYSSFALPQLMSANFTTFPITQEEGSWIACFIALMNPIGCVLGGIMMDTHGRKIALQFGYLPLAVSWIIIAFAINIQMIYVGVIGLGIGVGVTFCSFTYIAEITTPENRGILMSLLDPAYAVGILFCNVSVDYLLWDKSAVIFAFISVYFFVCLLFVPESPLWLLSKREPEKALKNLSGLRRKPAHEVYPELEKLQLFVESSYNERTFKEYCTIVRTSWKPLRMLIVLALLQQATGYTVLIGYTVLFFDRLRTGYDSYRTTICYSIVSLLSCLFVPWAVSKFRRTVLLTYSACGMAVSMAVIAVYEYCYENDEIKPVAWLPLLFSYLYVISCNYGVFPLPFVISGEIFPMHVRGVMQGIFGAVCFVIIAVFVKIFPGLLLSYGAAYVTGTFAFFSLLTALYGKYALPETKDKSLQHIRQDFEDR